MKNSNITGSMTPPLQGNPDIKEYRCPHCQRFLFKGNVKKLNMLCHHCQEMIIVDENKIIIETNEK